MNPGASSGFHRRKVDFQLIRVGDNPEQICSIGALATANTGSNWSHSNRPTAFKSGAKFALG
jgi:hypothetical protein